MDPRLLNLLTCPQCKGELEYRERAPEGYACVACALLYRVEDDIPNFLVEEATPLPSADES